MMGFLWVYVEESSRLSKSSYSVSVWEDLFASCATNPSECTSEDQAWVKKEGQDADMQKGLNWLVAKLNIILDILTIIVTPAMILASWLMSPDWTSGDLFQIRPMLHDMWVIIANVTYFIYAILLIFIALATIFNSDKYGYKQLLPKLALGILMVPLTWWFIQFIISLSTIVTASVINIPMDVVIKYNETNQSSWWTEPSIPKETKYNNTDKKEAQKICAWSSSDDSAQDPGVNNTQACVSPKDFIEKAWGMYSNLMLYSFAVFKFQDVKNLPTTYDKIKWVTQIIHQGIIGAIMFIVYGLLVIALVFMLMMRAIKLWFYAIFSPLMTLKYVIGDGFFWGKENSDTFEIKEFVGLAFVPALVGLALSFGLIIVSVMMKPPASSLGACSDTSCTIPLFGIPDNNIVTERKEGVTQTTVTVGEVKYIFAWDVTSGTTKGIKSGLNAAGGIIGTIIIDIIALVFIWVAFMAAKNVSKAVKAVVDPFESLGKKVWTFAMSLPKYAPIPGTGTSISWITKVTEHLTHKFEKGQEEKIAESKIGQAADYWSLVSEANSRRQADMLKNMQTGTITQSDLNKLAQNVQSEAQKANAEVMITPLLKGLWERNVEETKLKQAFGDELWSEVYKAIKNGGTYMDVMTNKSLKEKFKTWSKSGNSPSGSTDTWKTSNIIWTKVAWDDSKILVSFNDQNIQFSVKDWTYDSKDKDALKKMIEWLTEEQFRTKSASISDVIRNKITTDMKWSFKAAEDKKEEPKKS